MSSFEGDHIAAGGWGHAQQNSTRSGHVNTPSHFTRVSYFLPLFHCNFLFFYQTVCFFCFVFTFQYFSIEKIGLNTLILVEFFHYSTHLQFRGKYPLFITKQRPMLILTFYRITIQHILNRSWIYFKKKKLNVKYWSNRFCAEHLPFKCLKCSSVCLSHCDQTFDI